MMYGELYQYFIQYKQLNLPGIGMIALERKPASSDFPNRVIYPPTFEIALHPGSATPSKNFFTWLSQAFNISERDAIVRFNDFMFELKQQLHSGNSVNWDGVGVLSPGLGTEIKFDPALKNLEPEKPVKAEKVIRDKAEHTVRVGEDQRTSAQMIELLNQQQTKKNLWWAWALVIGVLLIMFMGWYFSMNGFKISSSGNSQKVTPTTSEPTYRTP